ncbi:uncharacterized protein Tco025E_04402 [Trypanosoma conorhini]|uniref:Uncharacterized protein n=1 Tax=Trypanosoma conorhini TaxID=83891 RepID=A0A3R7MPM6_9TRYP|nr:uncharacterized protein Tco025E_04402 [Trypanosoma conorhini]RNF18628.1 hypothetical protein Tco025E_04402 [Trypanosoma conorhini]
MRCDCVRHNSADQRTRGRGEVVGFTTAGAASQTQRAGKERALVPTETRRDRGVARQRVCWRSVGKRPGIPELIDKPLAEPWAPPSEAQPLICGGSKGCPCLSCEKRRRSQKFACASRAGRNE